MSKPPESSVEGRESIGPWNYSARIPERAGSRDYAFAPLLVAVLVGGLGIFLGTDVARHVPFWSNAAVLVTIILSIMGALLSVWMFFGRWVWTAPQMALFGIFGLGPVLWAFQGSPLLAFVLYSQAPLLIRTATLVIFLFWHGWWMHRTAKRCLSIWADIALRDSVWIRYPCATVYRRSAAKLAMESVGVKWHPGAIGILLPFALCFSLYGYRYEIVRYLDVPWVPVAFFVLGVPTFVVCTTALTVIVVTMLMIPAHIVANTGNPVLIDMM